MLHTSNIDFSTEIMKEIMLNIEAWEPPSEPEYSKKNINLLANKLELPSVRNEESKAPYEIRQKIVFEQALLLYKEAVSNYKFYKETQKYDRPRYGENYLVAAFKCFHSALNKAQLLEAAYCVGVMTYYGVQNANHVKFAPGIRQADLNEAHVYLSSAVSVQEFSQHGLASEFLGLVTKEQNMWRSTSSSMNNEGFMNGEYFKFMIASKDVLNNKINNAKNRLTM